MNAREYIINYNSIEGIFAMFVSSRYLGRIHCIAYYQSFFARISYDTKQLKVNLTYKKRKNDETTKFFEMMSKKKVFI